MDAYRSTCAGGDEPGARSGPAPRVVSAVPASAHQREQQPGAERRLLRQHRGIQERRAPRTPRLHQAGPGGDAGLRRGRGRGRGTRAEQRDRVRPHSAVPQAPGGAVGTGGDRLRHQQPAGRAVHRTAGVREQRLYRGSSVGSAVAGNRDRTPVHLEHTTVELTGRPRPADTVPASWA